MGIDNPKATKPATRHSAASHLLQASPVSFLNSCGEYKPIAPAIVDINPTRPNITAKTNILSALL